MSTVKTKYLDKRKWRRLKRSFYKEVLTSYQGTSVLIGALQIKEVKAPLTVKIIDQDVLVADNHFTWLQIMPEDTNYSMTVMYNDKNKVVQYYFDINKSHTLELGKARREDMYLDVLALPDGRCEIVDEEDVVRAVKHKKMTQEEKEFAYKIAHQLVDDIRKDFGKFKELAQFAYQKVMER